MKATINLTPQNKMYGLPEVIETVEIGHCLVAIKQLSEMAKMVNESPTSFCVMAQSMSYIIRQIEVATTKS